jgi:anti-sigma-K factor RskA
MSGLDRYQNPELYEMLAGEYVLGTMSNRVRRRFVQLMEERRYVQEAVEAWEKRFYPLAGRLESLRPPHRVWLGIRDEIRFHHHGQELGKAQLHGPWRKLMIWRSWAVFATILCAVLLGYDWLNRSEIPPEMPSYVAVLEGNSQTPMLVATAIQQPTMRMVVKVMDESIFHPDEDLQLWCSIQGSDQILSMGVVRRDGQTVLPLNQAEWDMVNEFTSLAVSAEPKGGSPTGRPTGPIMYRGKFVSLI